MSPPTHNSNSKLKGQKLKLLAFFPIFLFLLVTVFFSKNRHSARAASETHLYALIEVTTPLTNAQKILIRDAMLELGRQSDSLPSRITHIRRSLDNQKVIIEVVLPERITKAKVVSKLAESLPWSEATIDVNTNFTVFGSLAATWEESRHEAVSYLISHSVEWETSE